MATGWGRVSLMRGPWRHRWVNTRQLSANEATASQAAHVWQVISTSRNFSVASGGARPRAFAYGLAIFKMSNSVQHPLLRVRKVLWGIWECFLGESRVCKILSDSFALFQNMVSDFCSSLIRTGEN